MRRTRHGSPLRTLVAVAVLSGGFIATAAPARADLGPIPPVAPTGYVTMSDGVQIAINVRMPTTFVPGKRYPTIFEMSGYDGASNNDLTAVGYLEEQFGLPPGTIPVLPREGSRQLTKFFYERYVTVHASVRGTGCSGGEFDLFSWRSALDGREVIEWIAAQRWSNGRVGIMGHSYSGITGTMVAATQPPHLVAATVSGLIDDLYRAITYPGGVSNVGFPVLWTLGIRPAYDIAGGQAQALITAQDPVCAANVATHTRTIANDPVLQGLLGTTDNDWYRARSLVTYVDRLRVPIHITGAYQDEQTGPRGPAHLFEMVRGLPKRLVLTNGDHGTNQAEGPIMNDRVAWMDHWMRGVNKGHGSLTEDRSSVSVLFETHANDDGVLVPNGQKNATTFPLPDTRWQNWFAHGDGTLSRTKPAADGGSSEYFSGTGRQSWNYELGPTAGAPLTTPEGPDELTFRSAPVTANTAIAGPILATLFLSSTAPETQLFVGLMDEGPDGSLTYLNRGVLQSGHRAVDPGLSDYVTFNGKKLLYRPYRPHSRSEPIVPGEVYEYLVEVWPVGHVFRPGHRIVVKVHAPPLSDSLYVYAPLRVPSQNTLLHDAAHLSRIQLPVVPLTGVALGPEIPCGQQDAVRCIAP